MHLQSKVARAKFCSRLPAERKRFLEQFPAWPNFQLLSATIANKHWEVNADVDALLQPAIFQGAVVRSRFDKCRHACRLQFNSRAFH